MTPADPYAETDTWPTPDRWMFHEAQTGLTPPPQSTVRPDVVWRDRGVIIATQQARIAQLEAELDRLGERVAYYRDSEMPALRSNADGWALRAYAAETKVAAVVNLADDIEATVNDTAGYARMIREAIQ